MSDGTCSTDGCDNLIPVSGGGGAPRRYCLACRPRRVDVRRRPRLRKDPKPLKLPKVRSCEHCGEDMFRTVYNKRFCSNACQQREYRGKSAGIEDCVVCGEPIGSEPYYPVRGGVKHNRCFEHGTEYGYTKHKCRCDDCVAAKQESQREWAAANPDRVAEYGARRRDGAARKRWPDGVPNCAGCGEPMREPQPGKRLPMHKECEPLVANWKREGRSEPGWFTKVRRKQERAARGVYRDRPFVQGTCAWCGQPFITVRGVYCSDGCKASAKHERRGSFGLTRRAREAIYERDRFMCHLCGRKVDVSLGSTDQMSASLDHVVPRSQGGSDDADNLRLAHRRCNSIRRDLSVAEGRKLVRTEAELSLLW